MARTCNLPFPHSLPDLVRFTGNCAFIYRFSIMCHINVFFLSRCLCVVLLLVIKVAVVLPASLNVPALPSIPSFTLSHSCFFTFLPYFALSLPCSTLSNFLRTMRSFPLHSPLNSSFYQSRSLVRLQTYLLLVLYPCLLLSLLHLYALCVNFYSWIITLCILEQNLTFFVKFLFLLL